MDYIQITLSRNLSFIINCYSIQCFIAKSSSHKLRYCKTYYEQETNDQIRVCILYASI